jgi:hypothetical protein
MRHAKHRRPPRWGERDGRRWFRSRSPGSAQRPPPKPCEVSRWSEATPS